MAHAEVSVFDVFPSLEVYQYLYEKGIITYTIGALEPKPQEITYFVNPIPEIPEKNIPVQALNQSITLWEKDNNLSFVEVAEYPLITINWIIYEREDHAGLAICDYVNDEISECVLDITLGADNCNGEYTQKTVNTVSNTIMHEIGHALSLEHTLDENHLMFGDDEFVEINFNDMGYNIPTPFEEFYLGQEELGNIYNTQMAEIYSMDAEIDAFEVQWNEMNSEYLELAVKLNMQYSERDYNKLKILEIQLENLTDIMNDLIHQRNTIAEETIAITEKVNCFPNVK